MALMPKVKELWTFRCVNPVPISDLGAKADLWLIGEVRPCLAWLRLA